MFFRGPFVKFIVTLGVAAFIWLEDCIAMHYSALRVNREAHMEDQLTIQLPRDLSKALKNRAAQMQRRPSEVVRMAVKEFLQIPEQSRARPAERVRDLIGSLDGHRCSRWLARSQPECPSGLRCVLCHWKGPVITSEAVLTDSIHLLSRVDGGGPACIDFILRGDVVLVPSGTASLRRSRKLLEKNSDLPMGFADSTLVVLAEDLDSDLVFTLDRDFQIYRIRGRKHFRILPKLTA